MMPSSSITDTGALYSPVVGLVYVFNLIVGTGALTMPRAFQEAGWLLSLILVVTLCFMSYMTSTYVVEAMASSNAILRWKRLQRMKKVSDVDESGEISEQRIYDDLTSGCSESSPLLSSLSVNIGPGEVRKQVGYYDISERTEIGQMVTLFFNRISKNLFYVCITVYLYGDLAIYAAAVPKSLRDVVCMNSNSNATMEVADNDLCWPDVLITRQNVYRIFVAAFALTLGPFAFFNVQKTKYLQMITTLLRWAAFLLMILLCLLHISRGHHDGSPTLARLSGVPNLFGVCVYSFMCHHSLPSLLTPIRDKRRLSLLLLLDYLLILTFYSLLSFTAIFTFSHIHDLYTLNFEPSPHGRAITSFVPFQYFLALFPVFTLSSNFPIIAITLRNNLKTLFYRGDTRPFSWRTDRLLFPVLTVVPPVAVALATSDLEFLVSVTGSYAGAGIQYIFPAFLVLCSRKQLALTVGRAVHNPHASPFQSRYWLYFILLWAATSIAFVTVNHITTGS